MGEPECARRGGRQLLQAMRLLAPNRKQPLVIDHLPISPLARIDPSIKISPHMKPLELGSLPLALYRNLGWEEYFDSYSRNIDGRTRIATYSFNAREIEVFKRLMPFSVFYVARKYSEEARKFVRRFPMHLVFEVEELHTKCVLFERSGRLLVGSQNLFAATSKFEELSCETQIPLDRLAEVIKFCFSHKSVSRISPLYDATDVEVYSEPLPECKSVIGKAFLPTHRELIYWGQFGNSDRPEIPDYQYIYVVLEYQINGSPEYLAFDRHYRFCGELTVGAVDKLREAFGLRDGFVFLSPGVELQKSAPFKDYFARLHPIASMNKAAKAHYVTYAE